MDFKAAAQLFEQLQAEPGRLEMTKLLRDAFDDVQPSEMQPLLYLMQGKVGPDWEGWEFGLADKMIIRALQGATGGRDVESVAKEIGDLGDAAAQILAEGGSRQVGLFAPPKLTVQSVFDQLRQLAQSSGAGSQDRKQKLLLQMLLGASGPEAKFLVRIVTGRLRLGMGDMSILDALAAKLRDAPVLSVAKMEAEGRAEHERIRGILEQAYDRCSDLAFVGHVGATDGIAGLEAMQIQLGTPLRAMAAERTKDLAEILERHGGKTAVEDKYDGLRVQAHVRKGATKLFSRRLEDLTSQFPDAVAMLEAQLQVEEAVVEGECLAIDVDTGALRPFQDISRRRGRKTGLGEAGAVDMTKEIPIALYLFDTIMIDGENLAHEPYLDRRAAIGRAFELKDRIHMAAMTMHESVASVETEFYEAVARGAEGIMCKDLSGVYKAGNRGFDWIKFKTDYTEDLVDTMDLVVLGGYLGRGRRAGVIGALLMGVYNQDTSRFESVCKLGTGFDDATLAKLRPMLEKWETKECPKDVDSGMVPDIWYQPALVMEVEAAEITVSPTHRTAWGSQRADAGLAARFPRFTGRFRDDKTPELATTTAELIGMYKQQGKTTKI